MRSKYRFISSKIAFFISIAIISIVILAVWVLGMKNDQTIESNAIISLSILTSIFTIFLTVGLYRGVKLKDELGSVVDKYKSGSLSDGITESFGNGGVAIDFGDGIEGVLVSILLWVLMTIVFGVLIWLFGAALWFLVLAIVAMLYWLFFRATRLVFKRSFKCKGKLGVSFFYGLWYSLIYSSWLFAVLFITKFH